MHRSYLIYIINSLFAPGVTTSLILVTSQIASRKYITPTNVDYVVWDFWLWAVGLIVVSFCQVYRLQLPSVERGRDSLKTSVGGDACRKFLSLEDIIAVQFSLTNLSFDFATWRSRQKLTIKLEAKG